MRWVLIYEERVLCSQRSAHEFDSVWIHVWALSRTDNCWRLVDYAVYPVSGVVVFFFSACVCGCLLGTALVLFVLLGAIWELVSSIVVSIVLRWVWFLFWSFEGLFLVWGGKIVYWNLENWRWKLKYYMHVKINVKYYINITIHDLSRVNIVFHLVFWFSISIYFLLVLMVLFSFIKCFQYSFPLQHTQLYNLFKCVSY